MKSSKVRELKKIAAALPDKWDDSSMTTIISGEDAGKTVVGKSPYNEEKNYTYKTPVLTKVNHVRRLKEGVKKHGDGFIDTYLKLIANG